MKLVFVSNYFNHHQKPVSDAFSRLAESYYFIETTHMPEKRIQMGYDYLSRPDYVLQYYEPLQKEQCEKILRGADAVMAGSVPEPLFRQCVNEKKLMFRYSERPLKNGPEPLKYLPRLVRWRRNNPPGANVYLMCAGAYTAGDYAKFGLFRGRAFRWGYFPETVRFPEAESLIRKKDPKKILWAGRFLNWKHPDDAVHAAVRLREAGAVFTMDMIGAGEMEPALRRAVAENGLTEFVNLLGPMPPQEVRARMEQASVFLLTSDRREGWGAVINEAMNAGCACVVSREAGAAPYLIEDGVNGYLYNAGDIDTLSRRVEGLLQSPQTAQTLGLAAYDTVVSLWNAETAAARFLTLADLLLRDPKGQSPYLTGPCSPADRM